MVNSIYLSKNDKHLRLWSDAQFLGKERGTHRDTQSLRLRKPELEVDSQRSGGTGTREPIDGDPRQDCVWSDQHVPLWRSADVLLLLTFVVFPGIAIRPIMQFFVDPGKQANGTVRERITERLRLGALFCKVAPAARLEPFRALESFLFFFSPWRQQEGDE